MLIFMQKYTDKLGTVDTNDYRNDSRNHKLYSCLGKQYIYSIEYYII